MINDYLKKVAARESLSEQEAYQCMQDIINTRNSRLQVASLLTALSVKGETVTEITGFVKAMREVSLKVQSHHKNLVDTCGTGGDALKTFNISTASALIAASCGVAIAKHGNRSITSKCGGADILEALGVNINCNPQEVKNCLDNAGMGFMFAPLFHPAMGTVASLRKELGIRTVFNILGPLTSPANADIQLLGVFDPDYVEPLAQVLKNLKVKKAMVVHGFDSKANPAMDEISTLGQTRVALLQGGQVEVFEICPEDFGIKKTIEDYIAAPISLKENLEIFNGVINGRSDNLRDESRLNLCLVNAAAILFLAGKVGSFEKGVEVAYASVQEGCALNKLNEFIQISNEKIEA
ncbi:MAG TPA: anthranilate phosphoribosyltransferase [Methanobacterium sp.]|nr:anthranilate phosphoribosyltransferase [Methanobacterium sp.]